MLAVLPYRRRICLVAVLTALGAALQAETIGFEPPDYVNGNPPIAPWVIQSNTTAVISDLSPIAGLQSLRVSGNNAGCYLPVSFPPTGRVTISGVIRLPYGNPEFPFGTFGLFRVANTWRWEAAVTFFQNAGVREIRDRDDYVIGYFSEGGTYAVSFTWDWTADTVTLQVDGPGASITKVYPATDRRNLTRILCGGSGGYYNGTTAFDSILYRVHPSLPGDLDRSGEVDIVDLLAFALQWLQTGELSGDLYPESGDQQVNLLDLAVMAGNWLKG